jgi:hypothetical protein
MFFWHSLAFFPKGVPDKIRRIGFRFLWERKKESEGIPLVKWKFIEKPNESSRTFTILGGI